MLVLASGGSPPRDRSSPFASPAAGYSLGGPIADSPGVRVFPAETAHRAAAAGCNGELLRLAACGTLREGAHRPAGTVAPAWFNATAETGYGPSTRSGSGAFDPLLHGGEIVLFGGEAGVGTPTNATWVYTGGTWSNATRQLGPAPPGRFGALAVFDPQLAGIVLQGGIGAGGSVESRTWILSSDTWLNLSTVDAAVGPGPAVAFASATWDPSLDGVLVVGGCTVANCSRASTTDWLLNESGWHVVGPTPAGAALYGAALAFDYVDTELILFGGEEENRSAPLNSTFEASAGSWTNITASAAGCTPVCASPRAGVFAALTWSTPSSALLLFGGTDPLNQSATNATWEFVHGKWSSLTGLPSPPATLAPEFVSDSTSLAPVLLDFECRAICPLSSWSWGVPPAPRFTVFAPNPADAGATVGIDFANDPGYGTGPDESWSADYADGSIDVGSQPGVNITTVWAVLLHHSWSRAGSFPIVVTVSDFLHRSGTISVTALISPRLFVEVRASNSSVEVGSPVGLAAVLSGGIPPANVTWSFGDGGVGAGANTSHTFPAPGNYTLGVRATDNGGGLALANLTISVVRALSVSLAANWSAVDPGVPVGFVGSALGGTGNFTSFAWEFGDGENGNGTSPVHNFSLAGSYTVALRVTDSAGDVGVGRLALTVNPVLVAVPVASSSTTLVGSLVDFGDNRTGGTGPFAYAWEFGDGASSGAEYPSHAYAVPGEYTVHLWVNDSGGGSSQGLLRVAVGGVGNGSPRLPILFLELGAVAAVGLGAGLLLLHLRKRRDPPKARAESPRSDSPVKKRRVVRVRSAGTERP
jgi:PKD repeat protein